MAYKRYTPEEKASLLAAYEASNLKISDFAKANGVSAPCMYQWLKTTSNEPIIGFTEIAINQNDNAAMFRLMIGEHRIEFNQYPDAIWFGNVLKALNT
jgi:transposase-like protein